MSPWVIAFLAVFGIAVAWIVRQARRAGPRQVSDEELARARSILLVTPEDPGAGWTGLGSATLADGIRLRFDAADDPAAEATLLVPGWDAAPHDTLANRRTIRLADGFETHHVHTGGYVFRVRVRGTGRVVGKEVRVQMLIDGKGRPVGGRIENDDDTDAAVGDWLEFEKLEILALSSA